MSSISLGPYTIRNKGFGDITTIDPMYQIGKMTEVFGPVGDDWGYDVNYILHDQLIFAAARDGEGNYIHRFILVSKKGEQKN